MWVIIMKRLPMRRLVNVLVNILSQVPICTFENLRLNLAL